MEADVSSDFEREVEEDLREELKIERRRIPNIELLNKSTLLVPRRRLRREREEEAGDGDWGEVASE